MNGNVIILYNTQQLLYNIRSSLPNLTCSIIFFLVGSYVLSQIDIPSYNKDTFTLTRWYIDHPLNAWSSMLYALPNVPMVMKIPLITLSISSFSLWSNTQPYINFIDVTSIYWVIVSTSLYSLPYSKHNEKVLWVLHLSTITFIGLSIYSGFYREILLYYDINIVPFTGAIHIICGITLYCHYLDNLYFNISSFIITCGYICKLQNIYYHMYLGTLLFHLFTAVGIYILMYMDKPQLKNININIPKSQSLTVLDGL